MAAGHEQDGGPVVDLADQQSAADVEADVEGGGEGLRHRDALEQLVGALVVDLGHRGLEPQGEEDAGDQQHDEGVERDLTEQEGPVVGEDLADAGLAEPGQSEAVVGPAEDAGDRALRRLRFGGPGLDGG
jgi:hypothetical protein